MTHAHEENRTCTCDTQALEPNENCPLHGAGEYPPRCKHCGQFIKRKPLCICDVEAHEPNPLCPIHRTHDKLDFEGWKDAVCASGHMSIASTEFFLGPDIDPETVVYMYEHYLFGDSIDDCAKEVGIRMDQWEIDNAKNRSEEDKARIQRWIERRS